MVKSQFHRTHYKVVLNYNFLWLKHTFGYKLILKMSLNLPTTTIIAIIFLHIYSIVDCYPRPKVPYDLMLRKIRRASKASHRGSSCSNVLEVSNFPETKHIEIF